MTPGYFNPIDAGGFVSFVQGAEAAGWYQLDLAPAQLDVLPLEVPITTQGLIVQAVTDLSFCYSPASTGLGVDPMVLYAGSTMFVPGRQWVHAFCVLLGASGTSFTIQFCEGVQGPTLSAT